VSETPSLSIFTIEADRKPLLAFGAKKYQEAEAFCADERVLTKLRSVRSGGVPLSAMTIRFCAFGWQLQRRERVTIIGRSSDHPRKISQPSFWSMWTKHRPAPAPWRHRWRFRGAPEDFQQRSFSVAARQLNFCSCFGTTHFDLRRAQRGLSSTGAINFRTRASRSAKMPAAFCLALPLPVGGGPAP
jgi:hypothetical protein